MWPLKCNRLTRSLVVFSALALGLMMTAAQGEVSLTKFGGKSGPTLKILYCYSCGYRKAYEEYVNVLHQKYPDLQIEGDNFNPPEYYMLIAKFLGIAKMLLIVLILGGVDIFQRFGQPVPFWWEWCLENRLYACIMLFFTSNFIEGHLITSGAFEILFNDLPIWSRLETGRMPQLQELYQIIDTHIKMLYPEMDTGFN